MNNIHPLHGHYTLGGTLAFFVAAAIVLLVWTILNRITSWDDHAEMFKVENTDFAIVRGFQIVGLAYGLVPVIGMTAAPTWQHVLWAVADGVWVPLLLLLPTRLISRVVQRKSIGLASIGRRTVQVALVEGMLYLVYGQIIGATLPGPGLGLAKTYAVALTFALLGMGCLTAVYLAVASIRVFKRQPWPGELNVVTKVGLANYVREGDWSATMGAMSMIFALGLVMSSGVSGTFNGWADGVVSFLVAVIIMVAVAAIVLLIVDFVVVRQFTILTMIQQDTPQARRAAGIMCAILVAFGILVSALPTG